MVNRGEEKVRVNLNVMPPSCCAAYSHRGQKIFSLPRVVPCFPLLGLTPSGLFMGLSSTIIYTSELILCSYLFHLGILTAFSCSSANDLVSASVNQVKAS